MWKSRLEPGAPDRNGRGGVLAVPGLQLALRSGAMPAPTGRTGQRSAVQAVPALLRGLRCAISLRVAQLCRCEHRRSLANSLCGVGR